MTALSLPSKVISSVATSSLWLLLPLVFLAGCRGCNPFGNQPLSKEELERQRREQQDSIVANDIVSLPTDSQRAIVSLKPGHWIETTQKFKSTREDLQVMAVGSVYRGQERVALPATNFVSEFNRRTVLPKGQEKSISLQFFVPKTAGSEQRDDFDLSAPSKRVAFGTELLAVPLMTPIPESNKRSTVNELKEHEYQLAVLSPQALSYQFLAGLDAVYWIASELVFSNARVRSYEVSLVTPEDNHYGLPKSMLTMSSLAVLVWDDVSPDDLSDDQQQAIVDWLHWGGQLIISGPTSWSRLQSSFLSPYLPSISADSIELSTDSFSELSATWITKDLGKLQTTEPIEIVGPPMAGLAMKLGPRGSWMDGTGQLVAESRLGRGRIVVTGFPLKDPRVFRWPYFSSFFSSGLLRRWPRTFRKSGSVTEYFQSWAAPFGSADLDARMHSNFRILSRDLLKMTASLPSDRIGGTKGDYEGQVADFDLQNDSSLPPNANTALEKRQYEPWNWEGAGAWNDYSGVSDDAVESLRAAAGIELPSRATILKLLGGYLLCLVPLNYLVFRLFRRLEFAWLTAPILALAGVVVVTRVAQLDIGFARRTIDLGVLELYDDYSRGHLTQYLALYTSLSTNYSLEFPEKDSAALPLGDVNRVSRRTQSNTRELRTSFGRADGVVLEPVTVYSNSTETLRAEQILTLPAPIRLEVSEEGLQSLSNGSGFTIEDCIVLRMTDQQQLSHSWIGNFESGSRKDLSWQTSELEGALNQWQANAITQRERPSTQQLQELEGIWLGGMLHRIAEQYPLSSGSSVLIGRTSAPLGQLKVAPEQEQYDRTCVVVVHLSKPILQPIQPDVSIMSRAEALEDDPNSERPAEEEQPEAETNS